MDFEKTNKKIKYIIAAEVIIDPEEENEIRDYLDKFREIGDAEIVDIEIVEKDED